LGGEEEVSVGLATNNGEELRKFLLIMLMKIIQ
jgi:hypothetical protein